MRHLHRTGGRPAPLRLPVLAALLVLGGCVWPMDPVPEWDFIFRGTVRRSDTGAPVPGAQVQVRLAHPDDPNPDARTLQGQTDASGRFDLRRHERTRATPPNATVTVTPPAGSGLAAQTVGGNMPQVFEITRDDQTVTYEADFTLSP
jgi:hypothetical protein